MAVAADFLVDLEAALQLRLIERAEKAREAPGSGARGFGWSSCLGERGRAPRDRQQPAPRQAGRRNRISRCKRIMVDFPCGVGRQSARRRTARSARALWPARRRRSRRAAAWSSRTARAAAGRRAGSRSSRPPECAPTSVVAVGNLLRAEVAKADAADHEHPEEDAEHRPVFRRLDRRRVEPGQEGEQHDRRGQRDDADQLVRDGAQDRVERQQIPFRHDMRGRHQRIGRHRNCRRRADSSGCRRRTRRRRSGTPTAPNTSLIVA